MQPTVVNILDQLLGVADITGGAGVSPQGGAPADGVLFKDILAQLGTLQNPQGVAADLPWLVSPKTAEQASSGQDLFADLLTAEQSDEAVTLVQAGQIPQMMLPSTGDITVDVKQVRPQTNPDLVAEWPGSQPEMPTAPVKTSPVVENFAAQVVANPQWQKLNSWQPADLEPAVYKVLDSRLTDNRLEMTLVGKGDSGERVRVSVPAEILVAEVTPQKSQRVAVDTGRNVRIAVTPETNTSDYSEASKRQLNQLFHEMRLTSLDLTKMQQETESSRTAEPVAVRLTAEHLGRQVVLQQRLQKHDIRTPNTNTNESVSGTVSPRPDQPARAGENALNGSEPTPRDSRLSVRSEAVPSKITATRQPFDLGDRFQSTSQGVTMESNLVADDLSKTGMQRDFQRTLPEPTPVRFTLPEQLTQGGKPLNQTLSLKIEPEHLGPARLYLSVRHDVLTARVMVDSPMAKAAVEGSLDQLTDQLSKAGIQVDRFEVSLGGNDARNEFLDRRPAWAQQIKTKQHYFDADEVEQVMPTPALSGVRAQYVHDSGVNLLA